MTEERGMFRPDLGGCSDGEHIDDLVPRDIVVCLREFGGSEIYIAAADEIERLRIERDEARRELMADPSGVESQKQQEQRFRNRGWEYLL